MASIPCAAYQAGHIHNQMRRQGMRNRHPSAASDDSVTSDSIPPPALVTLPATQPTTQVTIRDRMDRVSQWVGESFKKLLPLQMFSQTSVPEQSSDSKLPTMPENGISETSVSSRGSMVSSDT